MKLRVIHPILTGLILTGLMLIIMSQMHAVRRKKRYYHPLSLEGHEPNEPSSSPGPTSVEVDNSDVPVDLNELSPQSVQSDSDSETDDDDDEAVLLSLEAELRDLVKENLNAPCEKRKEVIKSLKHVINAYKDANKNLGGLVDRFSEKTGRYEPDTPRPCRYATRGKVCWFGHRCRYRHDVPRQSRSNQPTRECRRLLITKKTYLRLKRLNIVGQFEDFKNALSLAKGEGNRITSEVLSQLPPISTTLREVLILFRPLSLGLSVSQITNLNVYSTSVYQTPYNYCPTNNYTTGGSSSSSDTNYALVMLPVPYQYQ